MLHAWDISVHMKSDLTLSELAYRTSHRATCQLQILGPDVGVFLRVRNTEQREKTLRSGGSRPHPSLSLQPMSEAFGMNARDSL